MLGCLVEWKPGFFSFAVFKICEICEDVLYNHLVLYGKFSIHLDSIFPKITDSILPNTHAGGIFMRVEINNWYLKTHLGFILTISKNVQAWVHFLISILVIIIGATLTWVETSLNHYYFINQCRYPTVSLCRCWSLQVTCLPQFWRFQ